MLARAGTGVAIPKSRREDAYGTGKRIRHHEVVGTAQDFPTKCLAQRALDERIAHVNRVTYRPRPTARFAEFARAWENDVLSQYRKSTAIIYRTHIRKFLIPCFGEYAVKDLNPEMIQRFISGSNVSPKTTRNILITLRAMWTTARAWGYVTHNAMEGVVLPAVKRRQRFLAMSLGNLDPGWTGNKNGSGLEHPKPLILN
jgi:hypothetical protein